MGEVEVVNNAPASSQKSKVKKSPKSKGKESKKKVEETKSADIEFDDEDVASFEQQEKAKKVWKNLEFVEEATIASDAQLKGMAITPAPMSTNKSKKGKSKKRKRAFPFCARFLFLLFPFLLL